MSKKSIVIIIIIVVIVAILALLIFLGSRSQDEVGDTVDGGGDLFTFDSDGNRIRTDTGEIVSGTDVGDIGGGDGVESFGTSEPPKLRKITQKDTSGYGLFDNNGTTTIRYVDTESGNIFETSSKSFATSRITNTTILQTIDSLWLDEDMVVLRYIDENKDIQSFSAEIVLENEGDELATLKGSFLEKNIEQIDVYNEKIFALLESPSGSVGVVYSADLSQEDVVLNTALREIWATWAGENIVAINTKPSARSPGHLFFLNINSGSFSPVVSDMVGLSANVSRENQNVLYNTSESRGVSLWFLDRDSGNTKRVARNTLAEKCVWANTTENVVYCAIPQNISFRNLPDEWYKGNVSFSDNIWMINLETNEVELIAQPESTARESVDVIKISINERGDYIAFINKRDMTLWGLNLSPN